MKKLFLALSFFACLASTKAQTKEQIIQLSYYYAVGDLPEKSELNYWMGQPNQSLQQMVANHKRFLAGNNDFKQKAIRKSYLYSFGRPPEGGESQYWAGQNLTFDELNSNHVRWLATAPEEWKKVIIRAYLYVYDQGPSITEYEGWKAKTAIAFNDLLDVLEANKASRPRSYSLQSTSGITKPSLSRNTTYLGGKKVTMIQ